MRAYKVTIEPFVVTTTSAERIEQEVRDFLEHELMISEEPDSPVVIKIEPQ